MKVKATGNGILDEILLETEDLLRAAKLQEAALQAAILKANRDLANEENKKDPNRSIFYPGKKPELQKESDRIRSEIFEKKQKVDEIHKRINQLQDRKQQLLLVIEMASSKAENNTDTNPEDAINFLGLQEQERLRIANDLHDSTVQTLTALIHKTELVEQLFDVDQARAKIELVEISEILRGAIQEIRDTIFDLRQTSLSELGLWSSVREYMNKIQKQNLLQTRVKIDNELETLSVEKVKGTLIYKMIQEAVTNSVKHAKASGIEIVMNIEQDELLISVSDDGIGMKKEDMEKTVNYGLKILHERTNQLSGNMEINANKKGTEVKFRVPIQREGRVLK